MYELIKNPDIDWIGLKRYFIIFSIALLLVGGVSAAWRGFSLGIDFSGGTLVNIKFKTTPPPENQIREALARQGIDTSKVIIQPISDPLAGIKNEVLIRLPQRERAGATPEGESELDVEKRAILAALTHFNDPSAGAGKKVDLNTVSRERLREALLQFDPLGMVARSGQATAEAEYGRYATALITYRDQQRRGLITDLRELTSLAELPSPLVEALPKHFFAGNAAMISAEIVGPQVGQELRQRAIYVTLASLVGMLIYIAFRFEWIYGVAAVVAVFHDVLVTLGIFSLVQEEISLNVVAALLTLIGYSVNDTIVIFDRVRENLRLRRRDDLTKIVNDSINQTLSRTILTSGLTFLAVLALYLFGGEVLRGFSLVLVIGIIVGSYSTLAIASPVMLWWQAWRARHAQPRRVSLASPPPGPATPKKRKVTASR